MHCSGSRSLAGLLKSKQHRNVRALVNASRAGLVANSPAILQRRVRPLILPGLGRSFDIGLYVLVSSIRCVTDNLLVSPMQLTCN